MILPDENPPRRYGLISGWGNFPLLVAQALKKKGHKVFCVGVAGHADGKLLREICDEYREMGLGQFAKAVRFFRKHHVFQATMAGKIFKKSLLRPGIIWRHIPDLYTFSTFFSLFLRRKKNLKDDTLLLTAVSAFEKKGIKLVPATDLAPDLLLPCKTLTNRRLTDTVYDDVRTAWPLARLIGRLDFGQAVMVRDRVILAIEGIDGTDETIARASSAERGSNFTVLKIAKPNQDMRFDVPAIGTATLERMASSGADTLVVEAGRTVCVDPLDQFVAKADAMNIAVEAINGEDLGIQEQSSIPPCLFSFRPLTGTFPRKRQIKDLDIGFPAASALSRYDVGAMVTVRERAVLAVQSMNETIRDTLERTQKFAPDGFSVFFHRLDAGNPSFCLSASMISDAIGLGARMIAFDSAIPMENEKELCQIAEAGHIPLLAVQER